MDWTGGDGGWIATDNTDASGDTWYGEYIYLEISRSTTGFTPYAASIYQGNPGAGCGDLSDAGGSTTAMFIAPFVLDPNDPNRMLAGGSSLWLSSNVKAATPCWSSIKGPIGSALISAIAVKKGDSNTIWVGYTDGSVAMTTNGGGLWTPVGSGILPGRQVTDIAIDNSSASNVFVTFSGFAPNFVSSNLWRTTNAGANWSDISSGLPAVPVFTVAIHPENHNNVYIGTTSGIFDSINGLAATPNWSANDGPANVAVVDLSWFGTTANPTLLAATHGRSMWTATPSIALDFGDLPSGYANTLFANDGARHLISGNLYLGASAPSAKPDGTESPTASADADDAGVTRATGAGGGSSGKWLNGTVSSSHGGALQITIGSDNATAGYPQVFIDFGNGSGGLTNVLTEVTLRDAAGNPLTLPLAPGVYTVYFDIPGGAFTAPSQPIAARVRLSSTGGLTVKGSAPDGEVEDYIFNSGPTPVKVDRLAAYPSSSWLWLSSGLLLLMLLAGIGWRTNNGR